jgi:DNA polymerase-3 subunit delta
MGAIKAHEAERVIASPDPAIAVFLLYGPDNGLVAERSEHLAKSAVSDASDPFQLVRLDATATAFDTLRIVDEANTIGLFGGRRAIWVTVGAKFPLAAIEPVLTNPPPDTVIVLEAGDLAKSNPLRLAVEKSRRGLAVPCYGDEARGLDAVIDAGLRGHSVTISREARQLLLTRIGVDRRVSRQEVEKLATYVGENRQAELHDVDAIVGDASARDVDDIVDGVFSGALRDLDQSFQRLSRAGEDPGVLLGFVIRHAQALLSARERVDVGKTSIADAVASMRGVSYPRRRLIEAALGRWSSARLVRAITALHACIALVRLNPGLSDELAIRALWNLALSANKP